MRPAVSRVVLLLVLLAVACPAPEPAGGGGSDVAPDAQGADGQGGADAGRDGVGGDSSGGPGGPGDVAGGDSGAGDAAADGGAPDTAGDADAQGPACSKVDDCPPDPLTCAARACVDGACVVVAGAAPCDDGDPCTDDSCAAGACAHAPNTAACDDGDACTEGDQCAGGACAPGAAVSCDDGNPCTADSCAPATGCASVPAAGGCDDGDPCTDGDACLDGACAGGPNVCPCVVDGDCAPLDDGDPCTGTLVCTPGGCVVAPGSVVVCDTSGDTACRVTACDPATGGCVAHDVDGPCDDGLACTDGDACAGGACAGAAACDDGEACTEDACEVEGCAHTPAEGACDDGLACTDGDACAGGACVGVAVCDDGEPCTEDACEAEGCAHTPVEGACDDGLPCTAGDACAAGACVGAAACDDGEPCTLDTCEEDGCAHAPLTGGCDDGDACTEADVCAAGACEAGDPRSCDDGNPCTDDGCDPAAGCTHAPNTAPCDDGEPCTEGDQCDGGACEPGAGVCECTSDGDCAAHEDGDPCTPALACDTDAGKCAPDPTTVPVCDPSDDTACLVNRCQPETGACGPSPVDEGTPCDDGSACTAGDACEAGACAGHPLVSCNDGNPCTDDGCDDAVGCTHAPNTTPCDDGSACTTADACAGGACKGGPKLGCDDGDLCTADSCNPASGCAHADSAAPCDDGDACTAGDHCEGGACQPGAAVVCSDGDPCTADACEAAKGCVFAHAAAPCDDGDACTTDDACAEGACVGGAALGCDDGDPCTADLCNPASGCFHAPVAAACDDGDPCTGPGQCVDGACQAGAPLACDDGVACTADGCDPATGCVHAPQAGACDDGDPCTDDACGASGCAHTPNTAPCDDGEPCTTGDACDGGACAGGAAPDCGDGDACTLDTCAAGAGCAHAAVTCDDGDACTDDSCDPATGCTFAAGPPCDDGNPCTTDACDAVAGCVHTANTKPCDDGKPCTAGDVCASGVCKGGAAKTCDDANPCTDDSCDPAQGCVNAPNTKPCSDGDACTKGDACAAGACVPGPAVTCAASSACHLAGTCNPATGVCSNPPAPAGAGCTDGNACTKTDACDGVGKCVGASPVVCAAPGPCTEPGQCNPGTGACAPYPSAAGKACTDGNACTKSDTCDGAGACVGKSPVVCTAKDACHLAGTCDPATGACSTPPGAPGAACDDGDACTKLDTCDFVGACEGLLPVSCDDGNPCTDDSCDPKAGCKHAPNTAPCDDGNACSTGDACADGVCAGGDASCSDGNPCTSDKCDDALGCTHLPNVAACDDGSVCTQGDACVGGLCTGAPIACDDGEPCTDDGCDPLMGCTFTANTAPCDDGDACTAGDVCTAGACLATATTDCDDANPCTDDACDPLTGCLHGPNTLVYGACATGHPGECGAGTIHCQGGVGVCLPDVAGVGGQDVVEVPDGLVEQWGGLEVPGWAMFTSDGRHLHNVSFGVGGVPYAGWTFKVFDPSRGFALVDSGVIEGPSFYIDGVIADDTGVYLTEWTGLPGATRVARLDLDTRTVEEVGTIPGNGPITGQLAWLTGKVWMGDLWGGLAYRWAGGPWAPTPDSVEAQVPLEGVSGAGVLATDGVYLYVKRWAFYPGDDLVRRIGTGSHGTVAGKAYGVLAADPAPFGLAAAYHSDGALYLPMHDPYHLTRVRATGATIEQCNGKDDDCDGGIDEACEAPNDRCAGALPLTDGANVLELSDASGPDGADVCGIGVADLWYRGVASCSGVVTVDTCGGAGDAPLGIIAGDACEGAATCGRAACDGTAASLAVELGDTFLVRVGAGGAVTLNVSCGPNTCGDGVIGVGEACDDGNLADGDGCDGGCAAESCGDGVVQPGLGEVCDGGAANSDTAPGACRTDCVWAACGDGVVDPGEACDLGAGNSDTAPGGCRTSCQAPACGDGVVDPGEACDDGAAVSEDGCSALCVLEGCGDGKVQLGLGETCDDGNMVGGDGCGPGCKKEVCGDGIKQAALGEQCDKGKNGDATCGADCKLRVCVAETCNLLDDDCDGEVDEGCGLVVASVALDGTPILTQVPTSCQNQFDCNDQNTHTADDCVNGTCTHTFLGCDGQDADGCPDGRQLTTNGPCLDSGPALLWDFEEPGVIVVDWSGNGNDGVRKSSGLVKGGGRFGASSYAPSGGGTAEVELGLPATDFTMSAWFRTTGDGGLFAGARSGGATDREVFVKGGRLGYRVWPGPSSQCTGQGPVVTDGAWHLATLVCEAGVSCRLLLDGARLCTSKSWDDRSQVTDQTRFVVGTSELGGPLGGAPHGDARVDQVSVIRVPFADAEVAVLLSGLDTAAEGRNLEVCNGADDDCDGAVDESCEDGDACTVGDVCVAGACVSGPKKTCPATGGACLVASCDPFSGQCVTQGNSGATCDDGNACTSSDACGGDGVCHGTPIACATDAAWFPDDLFDAKGALVGRGVEVVVYTLNGQLGCIRTIDPAKQYGHWSKVPGFSETWTSTGLFMFGTATPVSGNSYTCTDTFPMLGTITMGLTNPCVNDGDCLENNVCSDGVCQSPCKTTADCPTGMTCGAKLVCGKPAFSIGGVVSLPWPTGGWIKEIGLSPPPINVALPTFTLGWLPGSQLGHLYAPLRPDFKYFVVSGQLTLGIGPNGSPPISLLNKQANLVIDPFDPMFYVSWLGQQNIKDGLDKEWKTHAKTDYQTGKVVDVRAAGLGFSTQGQLLHKANRKVWTGGFEPGGDLTFVDATNDAHAFVMLDAEITPFDAAAGTLKEFKVGIRGAVSLGFDPAKDGYNPGEAITHVWDSIFQNEWDDSSYSDLDFRMLVDADLSIVLPPFPKGKPLMNPLTGQPIQLRVPLAGATLLIDTTFDNELVSFRAMTTDFIDKLVESIPGAPLGPYTPALDLNGFVKRTAGVESWGVAVDVSLPIAGLVDFEGRLRVADDGLTLDGMVNAGVIKLNPYFELAPFETTLEFDGEKFCALSSTSVEGKTAQQDGSTKNTTCSVKLCVGPKGFEGSTFSCAPLCLGHTECAADGKACIWGVCQPKLANGQGCSDSGACSSGRCFAGFCVQCWPGTAECGGGKFCDNAGYCQSKLPLGALCVDAVSGSVFRNDWCLSGKCDTTCIECWPKSVVNLPPLSVPWSNPCPGGKYCGDDGLCAPLRDGGVPCLSVKQAGPADEWCASGDCGGPGTLCLECGPDTSKTCGAGEFCDPVTGITCAPKVPDGTVCGVPEACLSGACGLGVTTTGGTLSYCYTPASAGYDQACLVNAACKSGTCRAADGKCGCNGNHALCSGGWCDALGTCQPKWSDGHACASAVECASGRCSNNGVVPGTCYSQYTKANGTGCVYDDECASTHCLGAVCAQCEVDAHCGAHYVCTVGTCVYVPYCGDGLCNGLENCGTCTADCGNCCGNGICELGYGETCASCSDCACGGGLQCTAGACTPIPYCGDGSCNGLENCAWCPADCSSCCGNGICEIGFGETCSNCSDCGCGSGNVCKNGTCVAGCSGDEQCPATQYCDVYWGIPGTGSNTCLDRLGPGAACYREGQCWRPCVGCPPNPCVWSSFWGKYVCQ